MGRLDPHRAEIEKAIAAGATVSAVARALKVPRCTLADTLDRWERPVQESPGSAELEALRRLVDG